MNVLFLLLMSSNVILAWTYPRTIQPTAFVIKAMAQGQGKDSTLTVSASPAGVCKDTSADRYCAHVGCFPEASISFQVQAITPQGESGFSESYVCKECQCPGGDGVPTATSNPSSPTTAEPVTTPVSTPMEPQQPPPPEPAPVVIAQPPPAPEYKEDMDLPPLEEYEKDLPPLR